MRTAFNRILLLARQPLSPLEDGLNLRVHHLFRELAARHAVSLLYLDEGGATGPSGREVSVPFVSTRAIPMRGAEDRSGRLVHDYAPEVGDAVRRFLASTPVDVVVASTISMVPYARRIEATPVVVDLVDALSLLVFRDMRGETRLLQKLRLLKRWWWFRRFERREFRSLRHLIVVSPVDADVVRSRAPGADVTVIPNGVDADYFRPAGTRGERLELAFSGVMGFPPNTKAAIHFYRDVLPRIRRAFPDVHLTLVGKSPPEELREIARADPRVTLTGFVPDIRPFLDRALIYVAPMVSGAGIKNKILEAWAMAKPVVATPLACGGLRVVPEESLLVAKGPEAFARAVIRLLGDPELRERLGRRAREHVLEHYTWERQALRLEELLQRVCREGGGLTSPRGS